MTALLSALLSALLGAFGDAFTGWLQDKRAEQVLKDAGALQSQLETQQVITEITDEQNKAPVPTYDDVLARLQRGQ